MPIADTPVENELLEMMVRARVSLPRLLVMYRCTEDELRAHVEGIMPRLSNMLARCPRNRERVPLADDTYPPFPYRPIRRPSESRRPP